jgi:hypothetical protein
LHPTSKPENTYMQQVLVRTGKSEQAISGEFSGLPVCWLNFLKNWIFFPLLNEIHRHNHDIRFAAFYNIALS